MNTQQEKVVMLQCFPVINIILMVGNIILMLGHHTGSFFCLILFTILTFYEKKHLN